MGKIIHNGQVYGGGSGGSSELAELDDVDVLGVVDGDALVYDDATSKWVPGTAGAVDDVEVNGTSVVDANKVAQIVSYKELTRAEYDALPDTKLTDGVMYCIKDGFSNPNGFPPLIYSTEEREIGVWIDGKPLYQKTITFVSYEAGYVDVSDLHIDKMVSSSGFITQTNGNHVNIPYGVYSNDFALAYYNSSNDRLYCSYGGSFNVCDWYVTMRYTKTTDTAGSGRWATDGGLAKHYSTQEQIIGTWVDGKTLYERSFIKTLANSPDADTNSFLVASNVTGIETLVKMEGTIKAASTYAFFPVCGLPSLAGYNYTFHLNASNQLTVWTSSNSSYYSQLIGATAICTIQYTKTTN